jgi:predicted dehydrogenase
MGEMWIEGPGGTLRLDGEGRLWLRAFGANHETEQRFEWNDHLFGGDCVYACNRHILDAWLAGREPETSAQRYLRTQEIEDAVYESAASGRYVAV